MDQFFLFEVFIRCRQHFLKLEEALKEMALLFHNLIDHKTCLTGSNSYNSRSHAGNNIFPIGHTTLFRRAFLPGTIFQVNDQRAHYHP